MDSGQSKVERKNDLGQKVFLSTRAETFNVSGIVYVHMTPLSFYTGARLLLVSKSSTFTSGMTVLPFSLLLSFLSSFFSLFFLPSFSSFLPSKGERPRVDELWDMESGQYTDKPVHQTLSLTTTNSLKASLLNFPLSDQLSLNSPKPLRYSWRWKNTDKQR